MQTVDPTLEQLKELFSSGLKVLEEVTILIERVDEVGLTEPTSAENPGTRLALLFQQLGPAKAAAQALIDYINGITVHVTDDLSVPPHPDTEMLSDPDRRQLERMMQGHG